MCHNGKVNKTPVLSSLAIHGDADLNESNANPGEFITLKEFEFDDKVCGLDCKFEKDAMEDTGHKGEYFRRILTYVVLEKLDVRQCCTK